MSFEYKENSGSLFPPSDKAPKGVRLSGKVNVGGTLYWITMWDKDKPDQKQWNITLKPMEAAATPRSTPPLIGGGDIDDEVPF